MSFEDRQMQGPDGGDDMVAAEYVLGTLPAEGVYTLLARIFSFLYFGFFVYLYIYTGSEKGKPVPARLTYHG